MDYGTLPPEINSARMYSGPGADSMLAAAAAWDKLAAELHEMATSCGSMTSGVADEWQGPSAAAMSESVVAYVGWLRTAAAHAGQAAVQARAAADAYQAALASTVPPQLVTGNRVLRTSLAATNPLGQGNPAIAAAEAEYDRMWAQDAAAMYAYAAASAAAAAVTPFVSPQPPTGPQPESGEQEVISTGAQIISALPKALSGLSTAGSRRFDTTLLSVSPALSKLSSLKLGFARDASVPIAVAVVGAAKAATRKGPATAAAFGDGICIGKLSVPRGWLPTPRTGSVRPGYDSAAVAIGRWVSRGAR